MSVDAAKHDISPEKSCKMLCSSSRSPGFFKSTALYLSAGDFLKDAVLKSLRFYVLCRNLTMGSLRSFMYFVPNSLYRTNNYFSVADCDPYTARQIAPTCSCC